MRERKTDRVFGHFMLGTRVEGEYILQAAYRAQKKASWYPGCLSVMEQGRGMPKVGGQGHQGRKVQG